jgi:hypothetical protein
MTNIRHFRQWKGGNSRGVCEQETAEGDHYPLVPAVERGNSRGVCEQKAAEGDHCPPPAAVEKGELTRGLRTKGRRG